MKVTYLHGLESKQGGPKVDWMESRFDEVWSPSMLYLKEPDLFEQTLSQIEGTDLIIGSSMGGWFGYLLSTLTGIPTILFNPAVCSRTIELNLRVGDKVADQIVIQGIHDKVINPEEARKWLKEKGVGKFTFDTYENERRVPLEIFQNKVSLHTRFA